MAESSSENLCPICREGKLVDVITVQEITESTTSTATIFKYSCGHEKKDVSVELQETLGLKEELKTIYKSGFKVRGKISEELRNIYRSHGDRVIFIKKRTEVDTLVFQIVLNKENEPVHVHCKRCGNEWTDRKSTTMLSFHFRMEMKGNKVQKVRCLQCGREIIL